MNWYLISSFSLFLHIIWYFQISIHPLVLYCSDNWDCVVLNVLFLLYSENRRGRLPWSISNCWKMDVASHCRRLEFPSAQNLKVVFILGVHLFLCLFVVSVFNITVTATALCWFVCMPEPCYAKNFWHADELQALMVVLQPFRSSSRVCPVCLLFHSTTIGPHTRQLEWD